MKINFYILFFFIYNYYICDIITFPFKRILSQNINETNFYSYYAHNKIYTPINIGSASTEIQIQIKMSQYSFCIRNDSLIYNYQTSSSYKSIGEEFDNYNTDYKTAIPSKESFILGKEKIKINNNFLLTRNSKFNNEGILGLKIHENNNKTTGYNLISQLKANKLINKEAFFFNFDKDSDNGELIIGEYPHLIDKYKEKYPQYQFKDKSIDIFNYEMNFDLLFRSIFYEGKEIEKDTRAHIEIESGYIKGSKYFEDISYNFFYPHVIKKKCHREEVNVLYLAYICEDYPELDLSKFPEIKFYISSANYNLTLTYEDLFIKKDGKVYFLVVFDKFGYNVQWTLGNTFLKRNKLVFDIDKRIIGIYDENIKDINHKNNNDNRSYSYNLLIYVIIIIVAVLIIIGLTVFIIYKFFWRKRNKKPYEINEDYEYNAAINV